MSYDVEYWGLDPVSALASLGAYAWGCKVTDPDTGNVGMGYGNSKEEAYAAALENLREVEEGGETNDEVGL